MTAPPIHHGAVPPLRVFVGHDEIPLDAVQPPRDDAPSLGHSMYFTISAGATSIRLISPRRFLEVDTRQLGVAIQVSPGVAHATV